MKKFLLLCAAFLVTMHSSFAADCLCKKPGFTEEDETTAIYGFMAYKLKTSDIRDITVTETIPYAIGAPKCEIECLNIRNTIKKINVGYVLGSKLCAVVLRVTMMSKGAGFRSKIKQKLPPVCE
ncbi:MAG TPA: hypothetical protein VNJ08_04560 [Bacteriovoracaceae bacterium]|nr:hypothetical protein [Bacteriovoracaceae bacterium]